MQNVKEEGGEGFNPKMLSENNVLKTFSNSSYIPYILWSSIK